MKFIVFKGEPWIQWLDKTPARVSSSSEIYRKKSKYETKAAVGE